MQRQHDVLIVGAGLAGLIAACYLQENEAKNIAILTSGFGGTPYVAAFNAVVEGSPTGDTADWYCEDMLAAGYDLGDRELVRTLGGYTWDCIKLLERWGVRFAPGDKAGYHLRHVSGSRCPRSLCRKDMLVGEHITNTLVPALKNKGVVFYEETACVELLVKDGQIAGVSALKQGESQPSAIAAGVVLAAWGGIGHLYRESTYPGDIDGRTLAMGYDAGARLIDLEFVEFEPMVCLDPPEAVGEPCPTAMLGEGGYLLNSKGERFLLNVRPQGEAGAPKSVINQAILAEVKAGRGSPKGGVWVDLRHIPKEVLQSYPWFYDRLIKAGVDPNESLVEVGPVAHSHSGGLAIDQTGMTNIGGLFAAGEAAGGMHGACRMAGNAATQAAVSGYAAAKGIAAYRPKSAGDLPQPQEYRVDEALQKQNASQIKDLVTRYVNRERDAEGLQKAQAQLRELYESSAGDTMTQQLALSGLLLANSALLREESRGTHLRTDFPQKRDECRFSIAVQKGEEPQKVSRV